MGVLITYANIIERFEKNYYGRRFFFFNFEKSFERQKRTLISMNRYKNAEKIQKQTNSRPRRHRLRLSQWRRRWQRGEDKNFIIFFAERLKKSLQNFRS